MGKENKAEGPQERAIEKADPHNPPPYPVLHGVGSLVSSKSQSGKWKEGLKEEKEKGMND